MVKGFHATLPVACEHLRASRGSTFPTGPTHTGLPSMQIPTGELGYIPRSPDCQSGSKAPPFQGETGGASRVTRAPCALKPPSYTTPPPPPPPPRHPRPPRAEHGTGASGDRLRLLRARRDPVHRRAPRTLSHARRAPAPQPLDHLTRLTGSEHTPLDGREPPARDPLHFRERRPEGRQVRLCDRWQQLHQHEMGDPLYVARGRRGQAGERRRLLLTREPGLSARHYHDAAPRLGERQAGEQRCHGAVLSLAAALQHEAAERERPGPDGGAAAPPDGACQRRHLGG